MENMEDNFESEEEFEYSLEEEILSMPFFSLMDLYKESQQDFLTTAITECQTAFKNALFFYNQLDKERKELLPSVTAYIALGTDCSYSLTRHGTNGDPFVVLSQVACLQGLTNYILQDLYNQDGEDKQAVRSYLSKLYQSK